VVVIAVEFTVQVPAEVPVSQENAPAAEVPHATVPDELLAAHLPAIITAATVGVVVQAAADGPVAFGTELGAATPRFWATAKSIVIFKNKIKYQGNFFIVILPFNNDLNYFRDKFYGNWVIVITFHVALPATPVTEQK